MKVALTVWEDRISPVFDSATTLLLVEFASGEITKRRLAPLSPFGSARFVEMLRQTGISVLICGAISEGHANRISINGIELIPFISGKTESILEAFARGDPIDTAFSMPGCGKHRYRRVSGTSRNSDAKEVTQMPGKDGTGSAGRGPGTGQGRGRCKSGPGAVATRDSGRGRKNKGGPEQGRCRRK